MSPLSEIREGYLFRAIVLKNKERTVAFQREIFIGFWGTVDEASRSVCMPGAGRSGK